MLTHRWLSGRLLALSFWTLVRILVAYSCQPLSGRQVTRYQLASRRLSRVLAVLRRAQMLHPSVLAGEYGTTVNYVWCHLSVEERHYLLGWLAVERAIG